MLYANKVVVVTGASQGIGAAIAKAYADKGASVVGLDIVPAVNKAVDSRIVDLGDSAAVESLFAKLKEQYGSLHVLVNNGAISKFNKPVVELAPKNSHVLLMSTW